MALLAGPRAHDVGHEETDLGRREEFARALAGTFGELSQQKFVGAAKEIRLHIGHPDPIARIGEGLYHGGESCRVDVAFAIAFGCEIDLVDNV